LRPLPTAVCASLSAHRSIGVGKVLRTRSSTSYTKDSIKFLPVLLTGYRYCGSGAEIQNPGLYTPRIRDPRTGMKKMFGSRIWMAIIHRPNLHQFYAH
jgi:hypothetical protein